MATHSIRLSSMLSFDEEQEKDIIEIVESMQNSHTIGQFLSTLIRLGVDNPEVFELKDGKCTEGSVVKQLEKLGMSQIRYNFMRDVAKEVNGMKDKVDKIYEMVLKTYELALIGKYLGLEEKAENQILASFILQKQLKDLQDTLGVQLTSSVFASNKTQDTKKLAEDMLEYIIESYDSVVNQLKEMVNVQPIVVQQPIEQANVQHTNTQEQSNVSTETKNNLQEQQDTTINNSDDIVDFGNADFNLLNNFFGDN